jgi:hypothetical protein|tara:strand:- start:488 stop:628 length:141 start_codon:yes stop_codon:yes gene_type:complete
MNRYQEKDIQENCECGMDENNTWDDDVFDRFGCDCRNDTLIKEQNE